jgi:hypothetical protein
MGSSVVDFPFVKFASIKIKTGRIDEYNIMPFILNF